MTKQKVRPAVIFGSSSEKYADVFIVPLTSRNLYLAKGEFVLSDWEKAGLNVSTVVKKACVLIDSSLIIKTIGVLTDFDLNQLEDSLRFWLDL